MQVEDLLKLLVVALFLLPGLFGKKKKPTQTHKNPEPVEYEDPFEDFDFDGEDDFEEEAPSVATDSYDLSPEQEGTSVFAASEIEAALARIAQQNIQDDIISQDEIKNEEVSTNIDDQNDFLGDFNARQAVIYSEILTPKYINK